MRDAEWIADLLQHGLLTSSFIPPAPQRDLRELMRYRINLVEERARAVNRLHKTLEDTNLKLGLWQPISWASWREPSLTPCLQGKPTLQPLRSWHEGRMKANRAELEQALVGTLKPHHRFMLTEHLVLIDTLEEAITRATQEIETRVGPPDAGGPSAVSSEEDGLPTEKQTSEEQEDPLPLDWMEAVKLVDTIPRHQCASGARHQHRDWNRHESVQDGSSSRFVGRDGALYHAFEYPWRSQGELERMFLGQ